MRTKRVERTENYKGYILQITHYEAKGKTYGTYLCSAYLSENDMLLDKVAVGSNGKLLAACTATEKSAIKAVQKNIDK